MRKKILRLGLLSLLIAGIVVAIIYRQHFDAAVLENWVQQAGSAGPIVFMLIYII